MTVHHQVRFPNESDGYRSARNKLLDLERELRAKVAEVAAVRRQLPAGGEVPQDYVFATATGPVPLSRLFQTGQDTLLLYSLMYKPGGTPCPMCTAFLDSLNGSARALTQRISLAVAARATPAELADLARRRAWTHLRLLSSDGTTYNTDYNAESASGDQWPILNVFRKDSGSIRHVWASELFYTTAEAGQHARHIDQLWPLWNALDLTPAGRGDNWYPDVS
ncbi:MAG: DUF899 family protein [Alphaproteobacteria bacterium]